MRFRIVVAVFSTAFLTCLACGGGYSGSSPTSPSNNTSTITIVGDRGAQSFSPNPGTPGANQMVTWRNTDSVVHHIVLNDGSLDTGDIGPGASSAAMRLPADGANYHCTIHPDMVGSVKATGGAPAPPCTGQYC